MPGVQIIVSILTGAAILTSLCLSDFRNRVVRKRGALYVPGLFAFLLMNLGIYLVLINFFFGSPSELVEKELGQSVRIIIPIIVAFLYVGAGAATFSLGQIKFNFYERLISLFEVWFKFGVDTDDVRKRLFETKASYDRLRDKLEELHEDPRWPRRIETAEAWKRICDDAKLIEDHIRDLEEIRRDLKAEPLADGLRRLTGKAGERAGDLREGLIKRLKNHLFTFMLANAKSETEIQHMLEGILRLPGPGDHRRREFKFGELLVGGIVSGIIIGILLLGAGIAGTSLRTPWVAGIAVGVFVSIFYISMQTENLAWASLVGGVAGVAGQVAWRLLDFLSEQWMFPDSKVWVELPGRVTVGFLYGFATGIIIFVFRTSLRKRVQNPTLRGLVVAALGAISFFGISLVVQTLPIPGQEEAKLWKHLVLALVGVFLNLGLASACKLLRCKTERPASDGEPARIEARG